MDLLQHIPRPTIDRPFGVHLWPIFDKAFEYVVGYPASKFEFVEGVTPLSTFPETAVLLVAYYIIVFGGREIMKRFPAMKLNTLFMIHNFYLTAISATLLALFIEQLVPTVWRHGIFFAICDHRGGWTQPLIVLYYVSRIASIGSNLTPPAELSHQICRTHRHRVPVPQEETPDLPAHLSPRCHGPPVLHPADWVDRGAMGRHRYQPIGPRRHVLVLLPECPWDPHLVEGVDHPSPDHPVCH